MSDYTAKILKLSNQLRSKGYNKYADEIEYKFLLLKKSSSDLYSVFKETGESLLEDAHPEGSVKMEDAKDEGGVVETLLDQKKKIEKAVDKEPTGKLSANQAASLIKKSDISWTDEKYRDFWRESSPTIEKYNNIINEYTSVFGSNIQYYDIWNKKLKNVKDLKTFDSIPKIYSAVFALADFNSNEILLQSMEFEGKEKTIEMFTRLKDLRPEVEKLYRTMSILEQKEKKKTTTSPTEYGYTQLTPSQIISNHKTKIGPLVIAVKQINDAIANVSTEDPKIITTKTYFKAFNDNLNNFSQQVENSAATIDNKLYFKMLNDSFKSFSPSIKPIIEEYSNTQSVWNTIPNLSIQLKAYIDKKLNFAIGLPFDAKVKQALEYIKNSLSGLG